MNRLQFEALVLELEARLKRAVEIAGMKKKITINVYLSLPDGDFNLGIIKAEVYRNIDILNYKKPLAIYSMESNKFIDIDRGVLNWIINYKSTLDGVRVI